MAASKTHDWFTSAAATVTAASGCRLGWDLSLTASVAVMLGGYFLSPDLDTYSVPYRRWGLFRLYWWPYRKIFRHRSVFTHCPLVGTLGRLLWLSPVWWLVGQSVQVPEQYVWAALAGLEVSAMVHAVLDL